MRGFRNFLALRSSTSNNSPVLSQHLQPATTIFLLIASIDAQFTVKIWAPGITQKIKHLKAFQETDVERIAISVKLDQTAV